MKEGIVWLGQGPPDVDSTYPDELAIQGFTLGLDGRLTRAAASR